MLLSSLLSYPYVFHLSDVDVVINNILGRIECYLRGTNGTDKNIKLITFKAHLRVHVQVVPVHTRPVQQSAVVITINTGETCVCVALFQYPIWTLWRRRRRGGGSEIEWTCDKIRLVWLTVTEVVIRPLLLIVEKPTHTIWNDNDTMEWRVGGGGRTWKVLSSHPRQHWNIQCRNELGTTTFILCLFPRKTIPGGQMIIIEAKDNDSVVSGIH